MDGFSIRPMDHGNFKRTSSKIEAASHTLGNFKNDREKFDRES